MKSIQLFEFDIMAFVNHTKIMGAPIFALILYIIAYIVMYKIDSNLAPPFQIIIVIGFSSVKISKGSR